MDKVDGDTMNCRTLTGLVFLWCGVLSGCGPESESDDPLQQGDLNLVTEDGGIVYAQDVIRFDAGEGAGFGQQDLPGVILGPPEGGGPNKGSLDVVSLGVQGEVVLGFGEAVLTDGPGVDLIVFENAFEYGDGMIFAEFGEVSVSEDGESWHRFVCDVESGLGCAGGSVSRAFDFASGEDFTHEDVGGDGFDLAELGLDYVRYVKVQDVSTSGASPSAGFDLDAVVGMYGVLDK